MALTILCVSFTLLLLLGVPVAFSIAPSRRRSRLAANRIASPVRPARPVRPMRWI